MSRQRLSAVLLPAALVPAAFILTLTAIGRAAYGRSACEVPAAYPTVQSAIDDPTCEAIMVAPGTYGEHLTVGRSLSIHGQEGAILDGGGTGRVVTVQPGLVLTLTGLTIQNGAADLGAGVYLTNGTLIADHMTFADNVASGQWGGTGGAIFIDESDATSALTVTNSLFWHNAADGLGGAIYPLVRTFLQDVAFIGNHAEYGGALVLGGDNVLERAYFEDNSATGLGGAMASLSAGTITISRSVFVNNSAVGGGAIGLSGYSVLNPHLTIQHSSLISNTATGTGGAILASRAFLYLIDSTIAGNHAADGGAILTHGAYMWIDRSVLISNTADAHGGAIYSPFAWYISRASMVDSTLTGNSAGQMGGAIYSDYVLTMSHSTVYGNSSLVGGGIGGYEGWVTGTATLNSVIAGNQGGDCSRWIGSIGYNLDGDGSCFLDQPTDLPGVDPLLGPLGYYGGATQSFPLLPGSPAIDTGPEEGCLPVDQRGFPRPRDGDGDGDARCDRGAHEVWVPEFRLTLPLLRRPLAE